MEWKPIKRLPIFSISEYGDIRNNRSRKIRKQIVIKKYKGVVVTHNDKVYAFMIHREVAIAFIPNPNNLPEVDHIDRNKFHNYYSNLKWSSRIDNCTNRVVNSTYLYYNISEGKWFVNIYKATHLNNSFDNLDDAILLLKKSLNL